MAASATATSHTQVPVITIDGPTASGKGTITQGVARVLGWHTLDSGALYRLTALAARWHGADTTDAAEVARIASDLDVVFNDDIILLQGHNVTDTIRHEVIGSLASTIAAWQPVRDALLQRQRAFAKAPGLVADGRDMGTVVFPGAPLKIFLVADAMARAKRRYKQLKDKGISANLSDLAKDMEARDLRDTSRAHAPLLAAHDAHTIDSSSLTIDDTIRQVLGLWSGTRVPSGRP